MSTPRPSPGVGADWRQPLLSLAAMALTLAITAAVDPQRGALVLGATLALSLSRSRLLAGWRGRAEALLTLPLVALATHGVAMLLKLYPPAGAAAFALALFLSVWLRRFGPAWSRVGGLIALPFITLLIVPGGGAGTSRLGAVLLALLALAVVVALRLLAEALGWLPKAPAPIAETPPRASSLKPVASTRMAIQLGLALLAAFACAAWLFPAHRTWVVLAALLVCTGNRGRADVLHKSGLRVLGVAAGTVAVALAAAAMPAGQPLLQGPALALLLLAIVGGGLLLRPWSYAAWACAMTLVVALLQNAALPGAGDGMAQLWQRVLATLAGAACGLAASWWLLPVRSEPVLRLRLGETLALLSEYLAQPSAELQHRLDAALARLDEVAPPWQAWARLMPWSALARQRHDWLRLTHECVALARASSGPRGPARRALGEARKALREPPQINAALVALREALAVPYQPGPERP